MHRPILTCAFLVFTSAAYAQQQQPNPSDPYQGQSNPPADDVIVATQPDQPTPPKAKPHAGKQITQPQTPAQTAPASAPTTTITVTAVSPAHPSSVDPSANVPDPDVNGTDDGIVGI